MNSKQLLGLYVGAGLDYLMFMRFPEYDFVACDSRPCNQLGDECTDCPTNHSCTYHAEFIDRLIGLMTLVGYELRTQDINRVGSGCLVFTREAQTVIYYYNTPYQPNKQMWNPYHGKFDALMLSGFFPHQSVLKLLKSRALICAGKNSSYIDYTKERNVHHLDLNNVVTYFYKTLTDKEKHYNLRNRSRDRDSDCSGYRFMMIDVETGYRIDCSNIREVERYSDEVIPMQN